MHYTITTTLYCTFLFCTPHRKLISFVQSREDGIGQSSPLWQGYVLAIGFLLSQLIQTTLFQQLWYLSVVGGFHVRAALISVIYKKVSTVYSLMKKGTVSAQIKISTVYCHRKHFVSIVLYYPMTVLSTPFGSLGSFMVADDWKVFLFIDFTMPLRCALNHKILLFALVINFCLEYFKSFDWFKVRQKLVSGIFPLVMYFWVLTLYFYTWWQALRMSSEAKRDSTVGEIVNLMAVDAQRVQDVFRFVLIRFCVTVKQSWVQVTMYSSTLLVSQVLVLDLPLIHWPK